MLWYNVVHRVAHWGAKCTLSDVLNGHPGAP